MEQQTEKGLEGKKQNKRVALPSDNGKFDMLADELLFLIFSFLDPYSLSHVGRVSVRLRFVSLCDTLWNRLLKKLPPVMLRPATALMITSYPQLNMVLTSELPRVKFWKAHILQQHKVRVQPQRMVLGTSNGNLMNFFFSSVDIKNSTLVSTAESINHHGIVGFEIMRLEGISFRYVGKYLTNPGGIRLPFCHILDDDHFTYYKGVSNNCHEGRLVPGLDGLTPVREYVLPHAEDYPKRFGSCEHGILVHGNKTGLCMIDLRAPKVFSLLEKPADGDFYFASGGGTMYATATSCSSDVFGWDWRLEHRDIRNPQATEPVGVYNDVPSVLRVVDDKILFMNRFFVDIWSTAYVKRIYSRSAYDLHSADFDGSTLVCYNRKLNNLELRDIRRALGLSRNSYMNIIRFGEAYPGGAGVRIKDDLLVTSGENLFAFPLGVE